MILLPALLVAVSPVMVSQAPLVRDGSVFHSPGRGYRAEVEYEMRLTDFVPFSRFEVYDPDGRLVYQRPGDGITLLELSDQGVVVGAAFDGPVSGRAGLRFFDPAGRETGRAEIGFYGQSEFSADGSVFCVSDRRDGVRVFAAAGRELYNLGPANRFAVSGDGRLVALAGDESLALFRDGVEQGRVPLSSPFIRDLRFSADGTLVGYIERHGLRAYRTDGPVEKLTWHPAATDPEPVSLDLSEEGLVLVGLGKAGGRMTVLLLDSTGTERWRTETTREDWNAFTPVVRFGPGRTLNIETIDEIETYRLGEED